MNNEMDCVGLDDAGANAGMPVTPLNSSCKGRVIHILWDFPPITATERCDALARPSTGTESLTAAGGQFDPLNTGDHEGPYGDGHLGDLPLST